jgi:AIPR protein
MSNIDNIAIRQTWVSEQTERYAKELKETEDDAFLYLAASLLLGCAPDDIEPEDVVDGRQDKQVDFIHVEDDVEKGEAELTIIQAKNTTGFGSNVVIQLRNGLSWVFERPRRQFSRLDNESFKNRITELRQLRSEYGASNLPVRVFHVTNGDSKDLSAEYREEAEVLREKYMNLGFVHFEFSQIGAHELIELLNEGERNRRAIDLELPVLYDVNRASMMEFAQGDTKSLVCTVSATELAKAAQTEPRDSIFDLNVRPFYGTKGRVNRDILATCVGEDASRFWFLNNGVTMVCDSFDFTRDPDNPILKIKNAQIVNGCQTTVTLRHALEEQQLDAKVRVLLRVYATQNPRLVEKITLTTNNQNKVTDRDLRANDPVQRDIERMMLEKYDHYYERKNKQHKNLRAGNRKKIVPAPKAAQAYLAIVRAKPANARGYLGAIWSDFYEEIFQNASVADLLFSYKLLQYCREQAKVAKRTLGLSTRDRACRVYGVFHVARAMGHSAMQGQWGHANVVTVEKALKALKPAALASAYSEAISLVVDIRRQDEKTHAIPAMYFKNSVSQKKLNAKLNAS